LFRNNPQNWGEIFQTLRDFQKAPPSITLLASHKYSTYQLLIATLISLRTKDNVTLAAAQRLFAIANTPSEICNLSHKKIEKIIFPSGFYKRKAKTIQQISCILVHQYNGILPSKEALLLNLPGVGRKTATLVLGLGFHIPAICVDTHVHRIANRMGWIKTKKVEDTELELRTLVPKQYWIEINSLLVSFGQQICRPISPLCSHCMFQTTCPKKNVKQYR